MKLGDHEKFNDCCGIAFVKNEVKKKKYYVVYANVYNYKLHEYELGDAIGKGLTKEEALIDAIKFLVDREKKYSNELDEENPNSMISKLKEVNYYLEFRQLGNNDPVVLPIQSWEYKDGEYRDKENEFWNADIILDNENKAVEATL